MTERPNENQPTLANLYETIKELLYVEDTKIVDTILAIMLSRIQQHSKIWLIIIGKSGDGKTELLRLLEEPESTYTLKTLTKNTFVNGRKNKERYPDLAPQLKDKVVLIPEMAQILTLHQEEKSAVWAQLRDLYDGEAGKNSAEAQTRYTDLNITLIACSTPAIDDQVLIHQSLGTRELLYRTEDKDEQKLMEKVIQNSNEDKKAKRQKAKQTINEFLKARKYENAPIKSDILDKIKKWAQTTAKLRATPSIDYTTGELTNLIYPEQPTRILEQLITLYRALKSLDEQYTDEKALEIIKKIVISTCSPLRIKTLFHLLSTGQKVSKREVGDALGISKKTAYTELLILAQLGIAKKEEDIYLAEQDKSFYKFQINPQNEITQHLAREYHIPTKATKEEVQQVTEEFIETFK